MIDSEGGADLYTEISAEDMLAAAAAVFVGSVTWLGEEPGFVSGERTAYQSVGFSVTEVRRGDVEVGTDVEVAIPVVATSDYVTIGTTGAPALDPVVFQQGWTVLVYADMVGGWWTALTVSVDRPVA